MPRRSKGKDKNGASIHEVIQEAKQTNAEILHLEGFEIESLPDEIAELSNLRWLILDHNCLNSLPDWITNIENLLAITLTDNKFSQFPSVILKLRNLMVLDLSDNSIEELPEEIRALSKLEGLFLRMNQLRTLPRGFWELTNLKTLDISQNKIRDLPDKIGALAKIETLYLYSNNLSSLPKELSSLSALKAIHADGNPFDPALRSAIDGGLDVLRNYLASLQGTKEVLYEAKLILVGEGNVGKTTLLKALRGEKTREGETSTYGADVKVHALELAVPDNQNVNILFNAWDFGGQDSYRITHQFFFSKQALYLLVWEPRRGVLQCQVEDWLRLIRTRVGSEAKVIIVSTCCRSDQRDTGIDKAEFDRNYGDIIVAYHEVDSLVEDTDSGVPVGIPELKEIIARTASRLPQMGMTYNKKWLEARNSMLALRTETPYLSFGEFVELCHSKFGLSELDANTIARHTNMLGYTVYFADEEKLKDRIILRPEWLIKAIGLVVTNSKTREMSGILSDNRLYEVLHDHGLSEEPQFDPILYPFFLLLMAKFDVLYRLKADSASVVGQLVPNERPSLPWLPEDNPSKDFRKLAIICEMKEVPEGIVPWMIVRTHRYSKTVINNISGEECRLHWARGLFVTNGDYGEALLVLRDREFQIYVMAAWPEYFAKELMNILDHVFMENLPGMERKYRFSVPCPTRQGSEYCAGRFGIEALQNALKRNHARFPCQICFKDHLIDDLLHGFALKKSDLERIDIEKLLMDYTKKTTEHFDRRLAEQSSQIALLYMNTLRAISSEAKEGPRLFSIEPVRGGSWKSLVNKRYLLRLWCEAEHCQHPIVEDGLGYYEFKVTEEWIRDIAPYANWTARLLRTILPMAAPTVDMIFGSKTIENLGIEDHLKFMEEMATTILGDNMVIHEPVQDSEYAIGYDQRAGLLALHAFLRINDPTQRRTGLKRVIMPMGDYRWLCKHHYEQYR